MTPGAAPAAPDGRSFRRARPLAGWQPVASLMLLLALWEIAAVAAGSRLVPGPGAVASTLIAEAVHGPLIHHLGATLQRVALAFAAAMTLGTLLGVVIGRLPLLDLWLKPWLVVLINVPALVVVFLTYVAMGLVEAAVVAAVALNKVPMVALIVREGARSLDADLFAMARLYRVRAWPMATRVVLPQLAPSLLAATRTGLALIWKIVLVAELLGRSDGIGFMLQSSFQLYDVPRLLAYSGAFMLCVLAVEAGLLGPLDRRLTAWRL